MFRISKKGITDMKLHNYRNLYLTAPITQRRAEDLNLRYVMGEENVKYYKYRFPVTWWKKKDGTRVPTLFCEFTIDAFDLEVRIDVYTLIGGYYPDFYCIELTNKNKDRYPMLVNIHKIIHKEIEKFGITQKEEKKYDRDRSKENTKSDKRSGKSSTKVSRQQGRFKDTGSRTEVSGKDVQKNRRRRKNDIY